MARSELTATREDRKYSSAILVRLTVRVADCKKKRSIIGAVCDNFGGNKHIFWLNLEQKKLFNNISGATASGMEPVCKWNVADSAPAAAAVLLVMIRPPFVSRVHHCLSADGGICGRGSKPGHDAGINGPYHPPCHGLQHYGHQLKQNSYRFFVHPFSSMYYVWLGNLGMLHCSILVLVPVPEKDSNP